MKVKKPWKKGEIMTFQYFDFIKTKNVQKKKRTLHNHIFLVSRGFFLPNLCVTLRIEQTIDKK